MTWPLSQDYNEAIQSPASNFADPDLRRGQAAANSFGLPMPCSGNFADVYQVGCPDGSRWAVKCFTREVPGLRERYADISQHLRRAKLPFTVDFSYLEQGIRVAGRWYPVLKMQWVEGFPLNQFVARAADKPALLDGLLQIWARMAKYLRLMKVGHCDLQHGNILLVPESDSACLTLKLVDYDGMWVPVLADNKSGELGHRSYQHPRRIPDKVYNLDVDRLPVLLVATALRALRTGGRALWQKYDDGDNLLFTETDLRSPTKSQLFLNLLRSPDRLTAALAGHLIDAVRSDLAATPLLEELLPETRPVSVSVPVDAPPPVRSAGSPVHLAASGPSAAVSVSQERSSNSDPMEGHPLMASRRGWSHHRYWYSFDLDTVPGTHERRQRFSPRQIDGRPEDR